MMWLFVQSLTQQLCGTSVTLFRSMVSYMLFFPRTKTSVVYWWYFSWPRHLALYTDWEDDSSMIFLDTIVYICSESSSNRLPTLENSFFRASKSFRNIFLKEAVFSWCLVSSLPFTSSLKKSSKFSSIQAISGPAIIHFANAMGLSNIPVAPPVPLTILLFCSCAWSSELLKNFLIPLCVVNWTFRNWS